MSLSNRVLRLSLPVFLSLLPATGSAQINSQFTQPEVQFTGGRTTSLVTGNFQPAGVSGLPDILYVNGFQRNGATYSVTVGELLSGAGFTNQGQNQITFLDTLSVVPAIADFDGDGRPDYAFALSPSVPGGRNLCVYYGTGLGTIPPGSYDGGNTFPPVSGKSGCTTLPIAAGTLPTFSSIAAAPFTTGGLQQIFLADTRNSFVYVVSNTGASGFSGVLSGFKITQTIAIPATDGAGPIYTGDFNRDGNTDFIVNNLISNTATVYLGKGDGTFQAGSKLILPTSVHSMLLYDMNDGDSYPDLIAEGDNGIIQIFHGNPDGSFGPLSEGGTASGVNGITGNGGHLAIIGDINHDGILDILTTTPIGLSVLLGKGGLTYQLKGIYDVGPGRSSFAIADFDGDGSLDLALDSAEGIAIVHGAGDGSFQTSKAYGTGLPALGATVGRFRDTGHDPKGYLDVAVGTTFEQGQLMINDGTGAFTPFATQTNTAPPHSTSALWTNLLTGDFDGDGNTDLLYAVTGLPLPTPGPLAGTGLYVSYGSGAGTFTTPIAIDPRTSNAPADNNFYGTNAIGDFNGDSIDDIANIDAYYYDTLLSQKTGGAFRAKMNRYEDADGVEDPDIDSFAQVAAGFFVSGRGSKQDLVFQDESNIIPYVNNGDGSFTPMPPLANPPPVTSIFPGTILIADIDGDGFGDIVIPYHNLGSDPANPDPAEPNYLFIWYGNGDGTFQNPTIDVLDRNYYLAQAVDMNGDSLPDLVLSDGYLVSILYNQGNRTFDTVVNGVSTLNGQHFLAGQGINSISIADVNNDGAPDIVVANGGATISNAIALGGLNDLALALTPNIGVNTGGLTVLLNNIHTLPVKEKLIASPDPSDYTDKFTLTATLIPSSGHAPTGTVTFSIDGTPVGTPAPVFPGTTTTTSTATLTIPAGNTFQGGRRALSAIYNGDLYNSPVNLFGSHVINGSGTTTVLLLCVGPTPACPSTGIIVPPARSTLPMYFGQTFNGTAQAFANDASALDPASTIAFNDSFNGAPPATLCVLLLAYGSSCPPDVGVTIGTAVGVHVFTGVYSGDTTHTGSTSAPVTITVLPDITTATVTSSLNPAPQGQAVTFTGTIASTVLVPPGSITFLDGATPLATVPLTPGASLTSSATFTTSTLSVGRHPITITYAASLDFQATSSPVLTQVITPTFATTTAIRSNQNPSLVGQPVTFTATVSSGTGKPIPTGTVTFTDGATAIGTSTEINGVATFTTSTLTAGIHIITATASGDTLTAPSSASLSQLVDPFPPPGSKNFSITVTPSPVSVGVGNAVTVTVTVTPLNGFPEGFTLSCASLPTESACTYANPAIPAGGGSTTLLLSTIAPHACGSTKPLFTGSNSTNPLSRSFPITLPALAGFAVLFIPGRRRWLRALIAIVAIAGAMQVTGCSTCTDLGTRPDAYTIHIVGTAAVTNEVEFAPVTFNVTI